jgi:gephyrin
MRNELDETRAQVSFCVKAIVEDEMDQICSNLHEWCGNSEGGLTCDVIFTTGGTGFSPRDVTPEATLEVIEKEASGLMSFVTSQCAAVQPLAVLSRGTCGVCGSTLIANLPGNPAAAGQVMEILLPLLLHAIKDLKEL